MLNLRNIIAEQGIPFMNGVHPPHNNLADDPLQAWHDSVTPTSSSDDSLFAEPAVQFLASSSNNGGHSLAIVPYVQPPLGLISLAATALRNVFVPDPRVDLLFQPVLDNLIWQTNCFGGKRNVSELYHPLDCFGARRVARKLNMLHSPADNSMAIVPFYCRDSMTPISPGQMMMGEPSSAPHRSRKFVPRVTSQVRRSTRSTRYDGFKVPNISDTKAYKSKVKPREVPDLALDLVEEEPLEVQDTGIPANTPVQVLQHIAINRCGVPPAEVVPEKLLARLQEDEASSSS